MSAAGLNKAETIRKGRVIFNEPEWAEHLHQKINWLILGLAYSINLQETLISNQDTLNAFVAALNEAVTVVGAEIQALKDQVAALPTETPVDFSAADAALANLVGLEPPAPAPVTPVETPPADGSTTVSPDAPAS